MSQFPDIVTFSPSLGLGVGFEPVRPNVIYLFISYVTKVCNLGEKFVDIFKIDPKCWQKKT